MRIAIANEAFNRKMSLLTSKLNLELKKKLINYELYNIMIIKTIIVLCCFYTGSSFARNSN